MKALILATTAALALTSCGAMTEPTPAQVTETITNFGPWTSTDGTTTLTAKMSIGSVNGTKTSYGQVTLNFFIQDYKKNNVPKTATKNIWSKFGAAEFDTVLAGTYNGGTISEYLMDATTLIEFVKQANGNYLLRIIDQYRTTGSISQTILLPVYFTPAQIGEMVTATQTMQANLQ